jgi:hypothetical protein
VTNISVTVAATAIANESSDGAPAFTTCLSTSIGCATAPSSGSATSRFSWARRAKRHLVELRLKLLGDRRPQRLEHVRGALEPEDLDRVPDQGDLERAALDQRVEIDLRLLGDLLRDDQVRLRDQRLDAVVDELGLERVILVDQHLDGGLLGVERRQRAQLVDQVRGDDQRCEHLAVADHLLGLGTALDVDALDALAEAALGGVLVELPLAERELLVVGDLVEEGDAWVARPAREREADQDRDHDRVDHEQRGDERRPPQDLEVFDEQPAH